MSKVFKGVAKGVKGIFKGVAKGFKKVWKSSIGKALIIGAAVFLTGGMAGWWSTPFTGGAAAGAAPAVAESAAAAGAGAIPASPSVIPVVESAGVAGAGAGIKAPTTFLGKVGELGAATARRAGGLLKGVPGWVERNPVTSILAANAAGGVFEQWQRDAERNRRNENFASYGDIPWHSIINQNPATDVELDTGGEMVAQAHPTMNPNSAAVGQSGLDIGPMGLMATPHSPYFPRSGGPSILEQLERNREREAVA